MIIRVLLIAAVLVVALLALRSTPSVRGLALRRMALLTFTLAWIGAVLSPDTLSRLAEVVGVGRGTDLLLYALVVAVALGTIGVYKRFLALEARLADLTRELALATASVTPAGPPPGLHVVAQLDTTPVTTTVAPFRGPAERPMAR